MSPRCGALATNKMKVLVFGAGAVGLTLGGFLSKDHEVTLLGRPNNIQAIRQKGLLISGIWGRHLFRKFNLATRPNQLNGKQFDLVLLTVKAYDTINAARLLKAKTGRRRGSAPLILSLQNGLGNVETLHRFFPPSQILAGRVIFGAKIPKPGQVKITVMADPLSIGETSVKKMTARVKAIVRKFQESKIPAVATDDVAAQLWAKVIYNCALNPLASLKNCPYGELMEKKNTRNIMDCVIREIYAVAKKHRVKLVPSTWRKYQKLFYSHLVPATYHHHPSMLQDLERHKPTEIDALNGAVMRLGKKAGVPTPINEFLTALIKEREKER